MGIWFISRIMRPIYHRENFEVSTNQDINITYGIFEVQRVKMGQILDSLEY